MPMTINVGLSKKIGLPEFGSLGATCEVTFARFDASSARESERQASETTKAMHDTCETLSTTSADAIDAVNTYVDAFNKSAGSVDATEGPAVDALNQSAAAVEGSMTDIIPPELKDALTQWVDGARATAKAITGKAPAGEFNQTIGDLNDTRSNALSLCDATY